ncbi:MAG: MFS transporter, partial [Deltaproteobacteria bacterium]|nr:MFS transporter [Deltaproteobacteria bacterium]
MSRKEIVLGLRENRGQFALLVVVNGFVGAMVGLERSILPVLAQEDYHLAAKTAILSFIAVFGVVKAGTNYFAGVLSESWGRKRVLVAGWLAAVPVPFILMWAPGWNWVLAANVLLGISQGLTWSTTVIMKIDLAGPKRRGLAMGLNEFAGYAAVALSALATGFVASHWSPRPEPFYLGVVYVAAGLVLSVWAVRETRHHAALESRQAQATQPAQSPVPQSLASGGPADGPPRPLKRDVFTLVTWKDRDLSSVTQAGLVNNLN